MCIRSFIVKYFWWLYRPVKYYFTEKPLRLEVRNMVESLNSTPRVYYLGITEQPNLGDMAQHYCILNWIKENYPDYELMRYGGNLVTNTRTGFIKKLKKIYRNIDIIVFQSGYCTQDLGGNHPLMHRMVIDAIPDAKILMMPQTVFFQYEENKRIFAENHNKAKNMLFLARDFVSYDMAKTMFSDIRVLAYPDIVTTLIGSYSFDNKRNGVCLCTRNDGEKLYSDEELSALATQIRANGDYVCQKDTEGKVSYQEIRLNLKKFIEDEIQSYSFYDVTITDRYHGTIFSLCAGTPVIIIKTTDHKVVTGADWFKGIYDDYVYVADDLNDAFRIYKEVKVKNLSHIMTPYMKQHYYDKLKGIFEKKSL